MWESWPFFNFPCKSLLIRGCSPNVNPLTTGRIDDKAERAVFAEEYSQLNFLKY